MRYLFKPEVEDLCQRVGLQLTEFGEWMTGEEPSLNTYYAYLIGRK
jgi:hypothetical protein